MRRLIQLFTLFVALCAAPALAADRAIIILDASGSMWAQIDEVPRIQIARDTLKEVLAGVSDELELGFMAYGHRIKGDCTDIEMLVDAAPGTAGAIGKAADKLSPKGKTPLTASVRMAAEALRYTEDKATVVLITDGIETCDADPCALASELEAAGVDFTVNVVGFGLSKEDGAAVQCLADNSGGKYISANDADGLKQAIDSAVNDTPPPAPEPEPEPEPVSDLTFDPVAILSEGSDPMVEGDGSITWEFTKPDADGTPGDWVRTEYGAEYQGDIEPGDYVVVAKLDAASTMQPVTIEAGTVAKPLFNLDAGYITIRPIPYEGAEPDSNAAVYTEFPDGKSTTSYGAVSMYVPAGETKIQIRIGSATINDTISVAAGERAQKDIVVGVGQATVNSFYVDGMQVEGDVFTEIVSAKADLNGNRESFGYAYGPDAKFELLPGDYVAVASFDAVKVEQPFAIKAGEASTVEVAMNAGVLAIDAPGAYYIEVFAGKKDIQGNRKSFSGVYDVTSTRTLPAGDYHIVVTLPDDKGIVEADASVTAGERTEISVP